MTVKVTDIVKCVLYRVQTAYCRGNERFLMDVFPGQWDIVLSACVKTTSTSTNLNHFNGITIVYKKTKSYK